MAIDSRVQHHSWACPSKSHESLPHCLPVLAINKLLVGQRIRIVCQLLSIHLNSTDRILMRVIENFQHAQTPFVPLER